MGCTLSEPVTTKETSSCANENVKVVSSCMQGWRDTMEDAYTCILSLEEDKDASFFAVYDGHGGNDVSEYASIHLHNKIVNNQHYKKGDIVEAIKQGFLDLDHDLNDYATTGSTAVVVLMKNGKIYCGNIGDSRIVSCVRGEVQPLSYDHNGENKGENIRVKAAGGYVVKGTRITRDFSDGLGMSRAFGDFMLKQKEKKTPEEQIIIALPEVIVKDVTTDYEFILLACDGIWEVLTSEEVVDFVRSKIVALMEPEQICEDLMTLCLAKEEERKYDKNNHRLGQDNMTVILVCFLNGGTYQELASRCALHSLTSTSNAPPKETDSSENVIKSEEVEYEKRISPVYGVDDFSKKAVYAEEADSSQEVDSPEEVDSSKAVDSSEKVDSSEENDTSTEADYSGKIGPTPPKKLARYLSDSS